MTDNNEVYAEVSPKMRINLQKLLDERGISLREFARMTGVNRETVRIVANGTIKKMPLDFLGKACDVLGCGIADILDYPTRR